MKRRAKPLSTIFSAPPGADKSQPSRSSFRRKITRGSADVYNKRGPIRTARAPNSRRGSTLGQNPTVQSGVIGLKADEFERRFGAKKSKVVHQELGARTVLDRKPMGGNNYYTVRQHMRNMNDPQFLDHYHGQTKEQVNLSMKNNAPIISKSGTKVPSLRLKPMSRFRTNSYEEPRNDILSEQMYAHAVFHRDGKTTAQSWKLDQLVNKKLKWPDKMTLKKNVFKSPKYAEMKKWKWTGSHITVSTKPTMDMADNESRTKSKLSLKKVKK